VGDSPAARPAGAARTDPPPRRPDTALVQIGLPNCDGLPVAAVEQARKLLDRRLPSNTLVGSAAGA
jgi:hypothetical protein